jgi:hypothetical protein
MTIVFSFVGRKRPIDEWDFLFNELGCTNVSFKDDNNTWYLDPKFKNQIQDKLDKHGPPDISFGQSMGGWAALYYQPQIQANQIIAFNPQATTISKEVKDIGGVKADQWAIDLENINGRRLPSPDGRATIYFGNHKEDGHGDHGHRLIIESAGYKTTILNTIKPWSHNIIGILHHEGRLLDIMHQHIKT